MDPMTLPLQPPTRVESQIKIRGPIKTPEDDNKEYVYRWWMFVKSQKYGTRGGLRDERWVRFIKHVESAWPNLTFENRKHAADQALDMNMHFGENHLLDMLHNMLLRGTVAPPYKHFDHPAANAYDALRHLWNDLYARKSESQVSDEDDTDDELIEDVNLTLALAAAKANVDVVAEKRKQRDAERCEWRKARRLHHVFAPRGMYMSASRERRVFHESHVFSDDESPDNAMEEHSATRRECDATKESTTTRQ